MLLALALAPPPPPWRTWSDSEPLAADAPQPIKPNLAALSTYCGASHRVITLLKLQESTATSAAATAAAQNFRVPVVGNITGVMHTMWHELLKAFFSLFLVSLDTVSRVGLK